MSIGDSISSAVGAVGGLAAQIGSLASSGQASSNPKDDVIIISNGYKISGWTSVKITCGAEKVPRTFDVELTEYFPGDNSTVTITPGADCRVLIGNDTVITGYIDKYVPSISPDSHIIRISGRGKCQDLVDCSAIYPNMQIVNTTAFDIATKLASVYGINVNTDFIGPLAAIPQNNILYGETAAEVIDRACKYSSLLYYEDENGDLFLTQVGTKKAASGISEGINVQQATATFTMDQRFASYEVMLQDMANLNDIGHAELRGLVQDPLLPIKRQNRTKIMVAQGFAQGVEIATQMAQWECNRRYGRSFALDVTIDSWRDSAGHLWKPNTICPLNIPSIKMVANNYIISEVTFSRDEQGTTARLSLLPPQAFTVQPILILPTPIVEALNVPGAAKISPAVSGISSTASGHGNPANTDISAVTGL